MNPGSELQQVDDLESIDALEEYIDQSQTIQIFVSKGYFTSKSESHCPRLLMHDEPPCFASLFDMHGDMQIA